jgi:diguanylate cyclase (GGDEF)-like protein
MRKILVIEDERSARQTLLKLLSSEGFEVLEAEDGKVGVRLAQTEQPDLILCDIMMPSLDGYGVLAVLQQDPQTATVPFICLTAKEERSALRRVMELGANDYLTKPFTRSELLGAISAQLGKQEMLKQQQTSALNEAIAKLNDLVYYDSLTNLPNRLLLRERFRQTLDRVTPHRDQIGVGILSLDRLDRFNNSLGTDYSDLLLQAVTDRVLPFTTEGGTVVRLNSEQLALIFPPLTCREEVETLASVILETLGRPFVLDTYEFYLSNTLGVALYPHQGTDIDYLLKVANSALHQAKQSQQRYQLYTSAMQAKSYDRLMLEMDLRHAIDRDELLLYYQPQIDLQTRQIVGLEALVRWQHSERGLVSPGEFIPLAEETGLIVAIDEWVWRRACEQLNVWHDNGYDWSVSVNLSGEQFNQPGLRDRLGSILAETAIDPSWLEIELTESVVVRDPESAIATLQELEALGIELCLDDFGTGYSSLSYLRQFPFDTLKIDRCFVSDLHVDTKNAAIVTAIVQLARSLNLRIVAEGIETAQQEEFLRQQGCDVMQGYRYSRPIPAEAIEQMAQRQGEGIIG